MKIGTKSADVEKFINQEFTMAVSEDCAKRVRARLSTVHLDAPGAFGGPEKFEKDSRWILRSFDRKELHRCGNSDEAIYKLEAASKPGKFLHCTQTGRSTVLLPKKSIENGQSCWTIREVNGKLQIRNLAKPSYKRVRHFDSQKM